MITPCISPRLTRGVPEPTGNLNAPRLKESAVKIVRTIISKMTAPATTVFLSFVLAIDYWSETRTRSEHNVNLSSVFTSFSWFLSVGPILTVLGRVLRKNAVFSMLASRTETAVYKTLNSLTAKIDPKTGLFGRKTGVWRQKKSPLQSCFLTFSWFFVAQRAEGQVFARSGALQKKSCQKTYRRFLSFWAICHNRAMIDANIVVDRNKSIVPGNETQSAEAGRPGSRRQNGKFARRPLALRRGFIPAERGGTLPLDSAATSVETAGTKSCQVAPGQA